MTAGDSHTVQCRVTDIPYLTVSPSVELIRPEDSVLATNMGLTVTHTLDPVMTSHAGQYTCKASVSVDVSESISTLTVQSMCMSIYGKIPVVMIHISPSACCENSISLSTTLLLFMLVLASLSHVL